MPISNLPNPGSKFKSGVFTKKLSSLTRSGSFKNLHDNAKGIGKSVASYASVIRRGGLSRKQQISVMKKVKAAEGSKFTKADKLQTRKILKHLGTGRINLEKTSLKTKSVSRGSSLEDKRLAQKAADNKSKRNVISSRRSSDFLRSIKGGPGAKSDDELKHDSMASVSALNPGKSSAPKAPPTKPSSGSFSNLY